jgi:hypothetical protein
LPDYQRLNTGISVFSVVAWDIQVVGPSLVSFSCQRYFFRIRVNLNPVPGDLGCVFPLSPASFSLETSPLSCNP